jgi:GntR family transcriptional repressor for pyruvate dehydrogenase complex
LNQKIRKIERVSITDQVVKQLQELIISGEIKMGDRLPTEFELCEQLGVGRSTVREAFRVLAATGMIEIKAGKGAFVKSNHENSFDNIKHWFVEKHAELSELIEVRMAIEPLALRLAVKRASDSSISQIREIHEAFKKAVKKNNRIELATLDESFHNAIIDASGNSLLIKIGKLIADPMMEFRTRSFAVTENVNHATVPHGEIVQSLIEKNEESAVRAMLSHLEIAREDMEKVVKD